MRSFERTPIGSGPNVLWDHSRNDHRQFGYHVVFHAQQQNQGASTLIYFYYLYYPETLGCDFGKSFSFFQELALRSTISRRSVYLSNAYLSHALLGPSSQCTEIILGIAATPVS
jgi:hypothetical protein